MASKDKNIEKVNKKSKEPQLIKKKEASKQQEENDEEERAGIIPEGLDFKKFLGCGG